MGAVQAEHQLEVLYEKILKRFEAPTPPAQMPPADGPPAPGGRNEGLPASSVFDLARFRGAINFNAPCDRKRYLSALSARRAATHGRGWNLVNIRLEERGFRQEDLSIKQPGEGPQYPGKKQPGKGNKHRKSRGTRRRGGEFRKHRRKRGGERGRKRKEKKTKL